MPSKKTTTSPILLGADHAGFTLKESIRKALLRRGHDICDFTPERVEGDDYPIVGKEIGRAAAKGHGMGIVVCGSGVGVAIAANRVNGARAVEGFDAKQVRLAREHNDANILTLGGWNTPPKKAMALVSVFLKTRASKEARHRARVKMLG